MLTKIHLDGYKGFSKFDVENLSRLNLISGRNNSGKTSLLEAIFLLFDIINPQMFVRLLGWRGIAQLAADSDSLVVPFFRNFDLTKPIALKGTLNGQVRQLEYSYQNPESIVKPLISEDGKLVQLIKSDVSTIGFNVRINLKEGAAQPIPYLLSLQNSQLTLNLSNQALVGIAAKHKTVFISASARTAPQEDAARFGELDKFGKTEFVLKALQKIEKKLENLSVILNAGIPMVFGDIGLGRKVPINLAGEGMGRLLSILLAVADAKNGVVLVDEIENGFHYSVMPQVWSLLDEVARENNTQIFATTHSREMILSAIEGLPEGANSDLRFLRLESDEGSIRSKQYDHKTLKAALDADLEIR